MSLNSNDLPLSSNRRVSSQAIAGEVGRTLDTRRPDTFRKSDTQQAAQAQAVAQRAGARNN